MTSVAYAFKKIGHWKERWRGIRQEIIDYNLQDQVAKPAVKLAAKPAEKIVSKATVKLASKSTTKLATTKLVNKPTVKMNVGKDGSRKPR